MFTIMFICIIKIISMSKLCRCNYSCIIITYVVTFVSYGRKSKILLSPAFPISRLRCESTPYNLSCAFTKKTCTRHNYSLVDTQYKLVITHNHLHHLQKAEHCPCHISLQTNNKQHMLECSFYIKNISGVKSNHV